MAAIDTPTGFALGSARLPGSPLLVRFCSRCGELMKRDGKVMRCECGKVRFS